MLDMLRKLPPVQEQLVKDEVKVTEYLGAVPAGAKSFTPLEGLAMGTWILVLVEYDWYHRIVYCTKITGGVMTTADGCWYWQSNWDPSWVPTSQKKCMGTTTAVRFEDFGINAPVSGKKKFSGDTEVSVTRIQFYRLRKERTVRMEILPVVAAVCSTEERTRLCDMYDTAQQIERTPFVLSKHQAREEDEDEEELKEGILELKDEIELVVDTEAGLRQLAASTQALEAVRSRSGLVTLHLSFPEPFEPTEVTTLLQSLGPHLAHLKAVCTTAAHCAAIVKVMESCPKEHLRVVSLLETQSLDRTAMEEFLRLTKTAVELMHFSEVPGGLKVVCHLSRQFPHLEIQDSSDGAVPEVPFPPKWPVKEAVPVSQLPEGQWAFITADPTSSHPCWVSICVPVDEALVKQHSQLLARMADDHAAEHNEGGPTPKAAEPRVFNASGEVALNVRMVQLLVAYIENVPLPNKESTLPGVSAVDPRCPNNHALLARDRWGICERCGACCTHSMICKGCNYGLCTRCYNDYPELTYSISLVDEYFLILFEEQCGHLEHTVNMTAVELLRAGDYLQMPALRRLMRSYLVRRDARLDAKSGNRSEPPNRKRGRT